MERFQKKLKMQIQIIDKDAEGVGVTRDTYSVFYAELCNKFNGEREKMPNVMNFPEEDLDTIGKISHHLFIQLGLFPFTFLRQQLNRLSLLKLTRQSELNHLSSSSQKMKQFKFLKFPKEKMLTLKP